jgi:hypothetical protein
MKYLISIFTFTVGINVGMSLSHIIYKYNRKINKKYECKHNVIEGYLGKTLNKNLFKLTKDTCDE